MWYLLNQCQFVYFQETDVHRLRLDLHANAMSEQALNSVAYSASLFSFLQLREQADVILFSRPSFGSSRSVFRAELFSPANYSLIG